MFQLTLMFHCSLNDDLMFRKKRQRYLIKLTCLSLSQLFSQKFLMTSSVRLVRMWRWHALSGVQALLQSRWRSSGGICGTIENGLRNLPGQIIRPDFFCRIYICVVALIYLYHSSSRSNPIQVYCYVNV